MDDNINILICDDEAVNIKYLEILLEKNLENVNLFLSNGGEEAIGILKNNPIDILLTDINMPDIDGWDVVSYINDNLKAENIAVIFITGYFIQDEFQKRGFELGAVDYITKPIDNNQLLNRLRLYIKNFMQERIIKAQIKHNKLQDILLFEKEMMLAQSNLLEKVAHHWRQPLSAISTAMSNLEISLELGVGEDTAKGVCDNVTAITKDLSNTIEKFYTFFKPSGQKVEFNLKKVLQDIIAIMKFNFSDNNIKLKLELDDINYRGHENEFKQIVLSVLHNGVDALIRNKGQENKYIHIVLKEQLDNITLNFIDNGGGIDNAVDKMIYKPYFTTKHEYTGTGLSLYFTKEILQRYLYGDIEHKNIKEVFKGIEYNCAEFTIRLKKLTKETDGI